MTALDYILDGLEAELELERELGVRMVEIDRSLLAAETPSPAGTPLPAYSPAPSPNHPIPQSPNQTILPLVFLHDRPLSPPGVEMMAKIITAMHLTAETAPVVVAPPVPKAKVYVVLGGLALKKYFPDTKGEPGQWIKSPGGKDVLITYSPAYILRFATVTPAVEKMKKDMWRSLKAVMQRLSTS